MVAQCNTKQLTDRKQQMRRILVALGLCSLCISSLISCSGDTGNNEPSTANDETYASDPGSTGTIRIDLHSETVNVSQTSNYMVEVRKGDGAPVQNIRVACDTERGLALIEPTSGIEATDSYGNMSGVLGCTAPGSFQIGCRLPIGANKRVFRTVKCRGNIPEGFAGFPGAGGGGLFGGVAVPGNGAPGGVGTEGVTISAVYFEDGGDEATDSIDILMTPDCDGDPDTIDPEFFTDSYINLKIRNDGNQSVRVSGYQYQVDGFTSRLIALAGSNTGTIVVEGAGVEATLRGLFLIADINGNPGIADKRYIGSGAPLATDGFKSIRITVFGENENGDDFEFKVTTGASFSGFNRCDG